MHIGWTAAFKNNIDSGEKFYVCVCAQVYTCSVLKYFRNEARDAREDMFPRLNHVEIILKMFSFTHFPKQCRASFLPPLRMRARWHFTYVFYARLFIHGSHSPDTHMADITWTSASCILRPFFMWSAWQLVCCGEKGHLQLTNQVFASPSALRRYKETS